MARIRRDGLQRRYDALPEAIKGMVTENEYRWMTEDQRQDLQADLTQPPDEADH